MPWKRLEDVFAGSLEDVLKTSWSRLQNVLKTPWRGLEDVLKTYGQDKYVGLDQGVLKTSSEDGRLRRTYSSWSRRLLKTKTKDVFKTSSRRLHQVECLLGTISKSSYYLLVQSSNGNTRISANIYLLKVNNRNTETMCEIYSNLTMKTTERRSMTLNLEHALQIALMFLLLTLKK